MEWIFAFGIGQALTFAILLFFKTNKTVADKILAIWFVIIALHNIFPLLLFLNLEKYVILTGYDSVLIALHGVMLFLYCSSLVRNKQKFDWKQMRHIGVFGLVFFTSIPALMLGDEEKINIVTNPTDLPVEQHLAAGVMSLILLIYVAKSYLKIKKYRIAWIRKNTIQQAPLGWLQLMCLILFSFYTIMIVAIVLVSKEVIKFSTPEFPIYVGMIAFYFFLGFLGLKQRELPKTFH